MTVLSDLEIKQRILRGDIVIEPFTDEQVKGKNGAAGLRRVMSYGLSSFGYDARLDSEIKLYTNVHSAVIDPKDFAEEALVDAEIHYEGGDQYILIPPNSFALCHTAETFKIPRDCIAFVAAKSTYARCGIVVNATILEPEWEGTITLELSNTTTLPARVYVKEGIVQIIFFKSDRNCDVSYADRSGKYQHQMEVTLPKV